MSQEFPSHFLPLNPATLHILLALAQGALHGYAIMQQVATHSEGQYKIGPGTLYDSLERLARQGLVEEVAAMAGSETRRRTYRLTSLGQSVLSAELRRLHAVLGHAKQKLGEAIFE